MFPIDDDTGDQRDSSGTADVAGETDVAGEADDVADATGVERARVLGRSQHLRLIVAVAVAFLVVAALKPWELAGSQSPPVPIAGSSAVATPSATADSAAPPGGLAVAGASYDPGRGADTSSDLCVDPQSWLVVDDDQIPYDTRTWTVAATTTTAREPGDLAIPATRIVSRDVLTLGFCAPSQPDGSRPGWRGTLWRVWPSGQDGTPISYDVPPGLAGILLRPPGLPASAHESPSLARSWPAGRYVLEARLNGAAAVVWLAVDIVPPS